MKVNYVIATWAGARVHPITEDTDYLKIHYRRNKLIAKEYPSYSHQGRHIHRIFKIGRNG